MIPWLLQMVETRRADGTPLPREECDYMINCAACHGLDRAGYPLSGLPTLVDIGQKRTRDQISQITKQGAGRMPALNLMSDPVRDGIIDYVLGVVPSADSRLERKGLASATGTKGPPYVLAGYRRFIDLEGYPAIKPPWGRLNAVDLNTGEIKWKVPLGEYRTLTARGIAPTGTEKYGGPVVTAGGLIFIAVTADERIRAFDKDTGAVLWEAPLPFGGNATPSTYLINGRQFVVISAGGGKSRRPAGGSLVAFALPDETVMRAIDVPQLALGGRGHEGEHPAKETIGTPAPEARVDRTPRAEVYRHVTSGNPCVQNVEHRRHDEPVVLRRPSSARAPAGFRPRTVNFFSPSHNGPGSSPRRTKFMRPLRLTLLVSGSIDFEDTP